MLTQIFKRNYLEKLLSTMISVKVWFFIIIFSVSTFLLTNSYITGGDWVTVVVSSVTVIIVSRESSKISIVRGTKSKSKPDGCPYIKE
jgi:hypothetical protein